MQEINLGLATCAGNDKSLDRTPDTSAEGFCYLFSWSTVPFDLRLHHKSCLTDVNGVVAASRLGPRVRPCPRRPRAVKIVRFDLCAGIFGSAISTLEISFRVTCHRSRFTSFAFSRSPGMSFGSKNSREWAPLSSALIDRRM